MKLQAMVVYGYVSNPPRGVLCCTTVLSSPLEGGAIRRTHAAVGFVANAF
jgi:hypothetical protein